MENGRQLSKVTNGTNTYTYTYDDNGIRTSKTVNGLTTNYVTDNGLILSETNDNYSINYWYDENNSPIGFTYIDNTVTNPTTEMYVYTKNMQGDITGILNSNGVCVVSYIYDAWGNLDLFGSTSLGVANGLRYRGYYYDEEIFSYYLQSRYYRPTWHRFLNSDDVIDLELNLFSYCYNDCVNSTDPTGSKPKTEKLSVVIFCDSSEKDFIEESKNTIKELKKIYNVNKSKIYYIEKTDKETFVEKWNSLEKRDLVILNFHGNETSIGPITNNDVVELERKPIKNLIVLGCNCAHQAIRWSNICEKLAKRISGYAIGSDGTVEPYCYYYDKYNFDSYRYDSMINDKYKTWNNIEKKYGGKRSKNAGWIIYYYKPKKGKIYCRTPKIKVLYIPYILDYLYDKLNGKYYERNVHYLAFMLLYRRNK